MHDALSKSQLNSLPVTQNEHLENLPALSSSFDLSNMHRNHYAALEQSCASNPNSRQFQTNHENPKNQFMPRISTDFPLKMISESPDNLFSLNTKTKPFSFLYMNNDCSKFTTTNRKNSGHGNCIAQKVGVANLNSGSKKLVFDRLAAVLSTDEDILDKHCLSSWAEPFDKLRTNTADCRRMNQDHISKSAQSLWHRDITALADPPHDIPQGLQTVLTQPFIGARDKAPMHRRPILPEVYLSPSPRNPTPPRIAASSHHALPVATALFPASASVGRAFLSMFESLNDPDPLAPPPADDPAVPNPDELEPPPPPKDNSAATRPDEPDPPPLAEDPAAPRPGPAEAVSGLWGRASELGGPPTPNDPGYGFILRCRADSALAVQRTWRAHVQRTAVRALAAAHGRVGSAVMRLWAGRAWRRRLRAAGRLAAFAARFAARARLWGGFAIRVPDTRQEVTATVSSHVGRSTQQRARGGQCEGRRGVRRTRRHLLF